MGVSSRYEEDFRREEAGQLSELAKTRADDATLTFQARTGAVRGSSSRTAQPSGPVLPRGTMSCGVATARRPYPDRGGPHVPVVALILSAPFVLVVALLCIVARPGLFVSLLAIGLTPIVVFATTLGAFMLRDRLRRRG